MATAGSLDLSVVVITLNEEAHLANCLKSLPPGVEIIILDSGSGDRTLEIAKTFGAITSTRPFDHHALQKNAAIALASRRWLFSVDADEELDADLRSELVRIVSQSDDHKPTAYRIRRQLIFQGRQMRFGKTRDWPLRLFKRGLGRFESNIHEHVVMTSGQTEKLCKGILRHYSYDNLTDYFERFNNYTSRIAANHFAKGRSRPFPVAHVLRPWTEFVTRYFLRLGFLDGYPGYCYALLSSFYTFVKYAKLRELHSGIASKPNA